MGYVAGLKAGGCSDARRQRQDHDADFLGKGTGAGKGHCAVKSTGEMKSGCRASTGALAAWSI